MINNNKGGQNYKRTSMNYGGRHRTLKDKKNAKPDKINLPTDAEFARGGPIKTY